MIAPGFNISIKIGVEGIQGQNRLSEGSNVLYTLVHTEFYIPKIQCK